MSTQICTVTNIRCTYKCSVDSLYWLQFAINVTSRLNLNLIVCYNYNLKMQCNNQQNMHLFQLEIITIGCHAFYFMQNGMLLSDVTITLFRQEKKMETSFFLNSIHFCSLENQYKSILPRNAHGSPNFDKRSALNPLGGSHKRKRKLSCYPSVAFWKSVSI